MRWIQISKQAGEPDQEEPEDWDPPQDLDGAWRAWQLLESTGWRHRLFAGGLLDQDEQMLDDVATISWLHSILKGQVKGGG